MRLLKNLRMPFVDAPYKSYFWKKVNFENFPTLFHFSWLTYFFLKSEKKLELKKNFRWIRFAFDKISDFTKTYEITNNLKLGQNFKWFYDKFLQLNCPFQILVEKPIKIK